MKIAAVSEDGITISRHFGRAPLCVVVTVENGKIVDKETRAKTGHHTFAAHHEEQAHGERHGYGSGAQARHASMMDGIADCQVLLAGGMGWGAYEGLKSRKIQGIVTNVENIDEAIKKYLEDKLPNLMDRLH